ncbi:hypothetical protein V8319_004294 [Escherichia coli]|nr:hypothetical protein [Escherichia coli]EGS8723948.1 hypothetical protein [Escherichia coli]EHC7952006.1 hypothetical protein [Escherichia coli]
MVRNKLKIRLMLLPLLYFLVWLRGTISFCSYSWLYIAPALLILFVLMFISLWCYRLERMLALSDVGGVYLISFVSFKLRVAVITFVFFALGTQLLPLIAYPFIFLIGVAVSFIAFSKGKRKDVFVIRDLLLKESANNIDIACYRILSGGIITEHISDDDRLIKHELSNNSMGVNPATGLPMVGASKSVDVSCNPYGIDLNYKHGDI